jgi:hypothetical protein
VIRDRLLIAAIDPDQARQGRPRAYSEPDLAAQLFRPFPDELRSSCLVVLFGAGATVAAFMTKQTPALLALGIPVIDLLVILLRCETEGTMGRLP